jgi:hypothetical protein
MAQRPSFHRSPGSSSRSSDGSRFRGDFESPSPSQGAPASDFVHLPGRLCGGRSHVLRHRRIQTASIQTCTHERAPAAADQHRETDKHAPCPHVRPLLTIEHSRRQAKPGARRDEVGRRMRKPGTNLRSFLLQRRRRARDPAGTGTRTVVRRGAGDNGIPARIQAPSPAPLRDPGHWMPTLTGLVKTSTGGLGRSRRSSGSRPRPGSGSHRRRPCRTRSCPGPTPRSQPPWLWRCCPTSLQAG